MTSYTDYLKKAGIKQEKIKGIAEDYKRLRKVVPSEHRFNDDGSLLNYKNKRIMSI